MNASAGRGRRIIAMISTAVVIAAGAVFTTSTAATAADPLPSPAPILQRDSSVVTSDNLPTVQINDGYVWAQTTVGNTVYAVGSFTNVRPAGAAVNTNLTPRSNILAFDITTGNLITSFAPTTNGTVKSIAASPDGSRIYIGGSFNTVNGQTRYNFAAIDAATGALVPGFSPSVGGTGVYAIATAGNAVYLGGLFTQANATARSNLAAFNTTNGALLPWAPTTDRQVDAMVMEPGNGKVIVAGRFYATNAQVQRGLAALDPTTGAIVPWLAPQTVINGWNQGNNAGMAGIFGLNADASGVYGTGWVYADVATGNLEGVFAANAGDGSIRWIADCHGDHYGVFSTGQTVYSTSHTHQCDTVGLAPELSPRTYRYAEAFTADARGILSRSPSVSNIYKDWSGTPSPSAYAWYPDFTVGNTSGLGQAGLSITGNSQYISIGGEFGSVNNRLVQGLVRFAVSPATGAKDGPRLSTTAWAAPTARSVSPGAARITIPGNWDRDDRDLTYELRRAGVSTPVATKVVASTWWNQPQVTLLDTGLTPGSSQTYTVTAKDGNGNAVTSQSVTVTIASGTASNYANAVLNDGASLYYRLGGVTQDWSGANNPVYGSGVTTTTPGALSESGSTGSTFSGTTTGRVSTTSTTPVNGPFSVEVWFKTNTNRGGKLIGYGSRQTGSSSSYDRHLYMTNDGRVIFGVYDGSTRTISSSAGLNNNAWHHAVGTMGPDGTKLYIDGALVASDATATVAQSYNGYWRIGGDNLGSWPSAPTSNWFAGQIDEAAVYPTAIPLGQVNSHYVLGQGLTPPTAAFTSSAVNLAATFDASTSSVPAGRTITGYAWNYGDGTTGTGVNPTRTYTAAGTYQVTLTITDSAGLTSTVTQPVTVVAANVLPTASFTSSVSGLTASVNGAGSADTDGTITGYSWNWGDGTAATTGVTSTHKYAAEGTYTVTLTVTDDRGGTGTKTGTVTATHAAPTADFTAVPSGLAVSVDGSGSAAADGATLSYSWNWGDSTAAGTGANASHTYAAAGSYNVTLTVTDSYGKTATKTSSVTVSSVTFKASDSFERTVASGWGAADIGGTWSALYGAASAASVSDGAGKITLPAGQTRNMALAGAQVRDSQSTMTFSLSAAPSTGTTYVGVSARQSASNNYTVRAYMQTNGNVWLLAQSASTSLATQTLPLTWAAGDTFNLKTEVTGASPTTIRAKIWKVGTAEPANWQLSTTDSSSGPQTAGAPNVHFARGGSATSASTLTVDGYRLVDLQGAPPANTAPTAAFTSSSAGLTASVNGSTSSDNEGAIASYSWNWGDSTAAGSGATASHTYAAAGTYQVTLTVTDAGGLTNSITKPVTVTAPAGNTAPTAAFTSTNTDLTASVNGSTSSDNEGAIASYSWNWGDGTAAGSGATASHTYAAAGTYQVTLTVTDAGGLTNSITKPVTVTAPAGGPDLSAFLAGDDFGRTSASGWGTADKGGAWTAMYGAASAATVADGAGKLTLAAGQTRNMQLNSFTSPNVALQADFTLAEAPATGSSYVGLVARQTATDNYQVRVWLQTNGAVWLVTQRGNTVLNTYAVPGITRVAGDSYTLSVQVTGTGTTTIQAKLWKVGTTEPAAWQITSTDATAGAPANGNVAVHANRGGSATAAGTFSIDNFRVKQL